VVIRVPQLGSIKTSTQLLAQEFPGTEVPGFTTIVNCSVEAVSISKLDALFLDLRSCDLIGKCLATYLPVDCGQQQQAEHYFSRLHLMNRTAKQGSLTGGEHSYLGMRADQYLFKIPLPCTARMHAWHCGAFIALRSQSL
jgi:hypothetical protein